MGIPRFFAFLAKTYPNLIAKLFKQPNDSYIEGLYVDLNSPIHTIAQRLFKYGLDRLRKFGMSADEEALQNSFRRMTVAEREKILFDNIGSYLFHCYRKLRPKKVFMIAVDGVAPKAKMVQQRLRRFKGDSSPLDFFDPVVISPGTRFMDDLDHYLTTVWPEQYKAFLDPDLVIIYSGHREPGEGEHKIFEQMTDTSDNQPKVNYVGKFRPGRLSPYQVVLGADSDLIVLSLSKSKDIIFMKHLDQDFNQIENPDIIEVTIDYTLRPPCDLNLKDQVYYTNERWTALFDTGFQWLNITEMRNNILSEFITPNEIVDFSMISFFVGNDFLPAVPDLEVVTSLSPLYFEDGDIELRYRNIFEAVNKPANSKQPRDKDAKGFNAARFWELFKNKEPTWKFNANGYPQGEGILNKETDQYEMFPYQYESLTGKRVRVMATRNKSSNKWFIQKHDAGNLIKCLMIYSNLMRQRRMSRRGGSNTFLVEGKNRINYVNLLEYLKEVMLWSELLMTGHASQYEELEKRKARGDNVESDPAIKMSLGQTVIGKKVLGQALVPAVFSSLNSHRNFGIYDSNYADPKLPKRSDEMCRKWLEGASWILKYYSAGLKAVNTQWFYPYHHAPTLHELITYLESRMVVNLPAYPDIGYSLSSNTITVERINIEGLVQMDPNGNAITNQNLRGHIINYLDSRGKELSLLILDTQEKKYIDIDAINFVKPIKKQSLYTTSPLVAQETYKNLDEAKTNLIETGRQKIEIEIDRTFGPGVEINDIVSDTREPYASVLESFFSIMPIRVLKMLMSPVMVDAVVFEISDAFPDGYEEMREGKYYEGGSIIKIPFLSPTRLRRAIDEIPDEFSLEIDRINSIAPRQQIMHRGTHKSINQVVSKILKGTPYQGGVQPNIASKTTKRQDASSQTTQSANITGGLGNALGVLI